MAGCQRGRGLRRTDLGILYNAFPANLQETLRICTVQQGTLGDVPVLLLVGAGRDRR